MTTSHNSADELISRPNDPRDAAPPYWDELVGGFPGGIVGLVFSTAWSVRVDHDHRQLETDSDATRALATLLEEAADRLEYVENNWDELREEYRR